MDEILEFYNKKPKIEKSFIIIFVILLIILLYYIINNYTYDTKELLMINNCLEDECILKTTLNYEEQEIINNNPIIVYKNEDYIINKIEYEEPYLANERPVTDINIRTDLQTEEKIVKVKIKYNKQRIISKIKEKLIERN